MGMALEDPSMPVAPCAPPSERVDDYNVDTLNRLNMVQPERFDETAVVQVIHGLAFRRASR